VTCYPLFFEIAQRIIVFIFLCLNNRKQKANTTAQITEKKIYQRKNSRDHAIPLRPREVRSRENIKKDPGNPYMYE
jgi:hypothetical protein